MEAKRDGDLQGALKAHAQAAKQFREAAVQVKDMNGMLTGIHGLIFPMNSHSYTMFTPRRVNGKFTPFIESNTSKICTSLETNCEATTHSTG